MELRQLRYFVAAADLENFTAASSRLNVAQSALSRQIGNLEEEIGLQLFARNGKRVQLTADGRRLREEARDILLRADRLKARPNRERRLNTQLVRIGAHHSFAYLLFPRLARRFNAEFPDLHIGLTTGQQSVLEKQLLGDKLDLSIFSIPNVEENRVSPKLTLMPLCEESVCVIGGRKQPMPVGEQCDIKEALSLPLIMVPKPHRERHTYEQLARAHGIRLNVAREADNLTMMKSMIADGQLYLILPRSAALEPDGNASWPYSRIRGLRMRRLVGMKATIRPSDATLEVLRMLREETDSMIRSSEIA